jgi:hypothetical protein
MIGRRGGFDTEMIEMMEARHGVPERECSKKQSNGKASRWERRHWSKLQEDVYEVPHLKLLMGSGMVS